jgi:hypothetical protein
MPKFLTLIIPLFGLLKMHGQSALTILQVDSIVATIDTNHLLENYTKVDSENSSSQTQKVTIYSYRKLKSTGQVEKIERIGNGTCDSKERYYFVNDKLVKAVIKLICDGKVLWDSELYYNKDIVFAQTDKATALYGPAFVQSAYSALKRIIQLETERK